MYFRFMIVPNVWIQSYSRDKIPLDQLNRPDIDNKRIMFTEMKHSVTGMLARSGNVAGSRERAPAQFAKLSYKFAKFICQIEL